jgi:hypothetical protein
LRDGAVELELVLEHGHTAFEPGSRVGGVAHWSARTPPAALELALIWTSLGWGGRDLKIVETVTFSEPLAEERRPFIIALPAAPYSFQGALIRLSWSLELMAFPGHDKVRVDLVIAPGRRAIDLR